MWSGLQVHLESATALAKKVSTPAIESASSSIAAAVDLHGCAVCNFE